MGVWPWRRLCRSLPLCPSPRPPRITPSDTSRNPPASGFNPPAARQARSEGADFRASHFVSLAARRCEDRHYDRALEAYSWMRDCAVEPSGEAVEGFAYFVQAFAGRAPPRGGESAGVT